MTTIFIYIGLRNSWCYYISPFFMVPSFSLPKEINYKGIKTGFECVTHTVYGPFANGDKLKFLIPSSEKDKCYNTLKLCQNGQKNGNCSKETIQCENGKKNVLVYFYGEKDPRPLLFCYGGAAYRPTGKDNYDKEWVKVKDIKKCVCEDKDECNKCDELLQALITVVGFLNQVDLSKYPHGTNTESNGTCINGSTSSGDVAATTCTSKEKNGDSCTYVVHKYGNRDIKVKVTCSNVPPGSNGKSCYKKLTHEPIGMCDARTRSSVGASDSRTDGVNSGFRLGNVVYNNGTGGPFKVPYYTENGGNTTSETNKSIHWCKPLVSVSAYFYNEDKCYEDPLLVVLEFKNGGSDKDKEYYKLKMTIELSDTMEWSKDQEACKLVEKNGDGLIHHLDEIRYLLKQVLKVDISSRRQYTAMGREGKDTGCGFQPIPTGDNKNIDVTDCTAEKCGQLAGKGYKCYQHKISELTEEQLYKIGGVAFTIPSADGEGEIEIELFNGTIKKTETDCQNGEPGKPSQSGQQIQLFYNRCMGDIYVYFYGDDPRPLMLCYDKKAYRPQTKDCYFQKWVYDSIIHKCDCSEPDEQHKDQLLYALTEVVGFLNEVDLSKHPPSTINECSNSAIGTVTTCNGPSSKNGQGPSSSCTYYVHQYNGSKVQISVTCTAVPSTPPGPNGSCYKKLTHTPAGMNGNTNGSKFRLGNVVYNGNGTSKPKGTISYYSRGSYQSKYKYQPLMQVTAYFYNQDKEYKDPLLVVLEFKNGEGAATVCEYYKLTQTISGSSMKWTKEIDTKACEKVKGNGNKLVEHLDSIRYNLKQVLQIKLEQNKASPYQAMWRDGKPGTGNWFEPLKGNEDDQVEIEVCEVGCTKLSGTNYKCFQHKITELGADVLHKIGGLAFTMPGTSYSPENEIKLFNRASDANCKNKKTYIQVKPLIYNSCMGNVCVYFYYKDPRPLMLCYNGISYRSIDKITYFYWWVKDCSVNMCDCTAIESDNCDKLLDAMVKVSDFLNPVDINKVSNNDEKPICYRIHWFDGKEIKIKVEKTPATTSFCYHRYIHSHNGTGKNDGKGFRLGTINYNGTCIKERTSGKDGCITSVLNGQPTSKYKSADKVVVFYYQGDTEFKRPLLVALCKNGSETCEVYYMLQNDGASSGVKKYIKGDGAPIDLSDTRPEGELAKKLDQIRFNIAKHLQIIIDKLPMETLYCFKCEKNGQPDVCNNANNKGSKCYKADKTLIDVRCEMIIKKNGKNKPGCVLLSAGTSVCYQAKLYESTAGTPGATTTNAGTKEVKVTQVKCDQLSRHGYKCYEHQITDVTGVDQIGGLRFYLWDNTSGGTSGRDCGTTGGAGCTSDSGGTGATCRELCLYKKGSSASGEKGTQGSCRPTAVASSQSNCGSAPGESNCNAPAPGQNGQLTSSLPYTTCKGNVYVYFYGEDPRPLMLCYGGEAYGPRCVSEYDCRWVCVVA